MSDTTLLTHSVPVLPPEDRLQRRRRALAIVAASLAFVVALFACFFTVDVTEHALVSRFGNIVRVVTAPGLHLKWPLDGVVRLDKRIAHAQAAQAEYLTVDKKNIVVESLATWRIADPRRFLETVGNTTNAMQLLTDAIGAELGAVLGRHMASALISANGQETGSYQLVTQLRDTLTQYLGVTYGIELIDVQLRRLSLPEQNRDHVFERMKAERGRMAKQFRSEGELESRKIIAQADRERSQIETEAQAQAQRLRAEGDAEASRIYHAAFVQDPRFYKFLRTLQSYEKFLDESTTLFIPAEAEILEMLRPQLRRADDQAHRPGPQSSAVTARSPRSASGAATASPHLLVPGSTLSQALIQPQGRTP